MKGAEDEKNISTTKDEITRVRLHLELKDEYLSD